MFEINLDILEREKDNLLKKLEIIERAISEYQNETSIFKLDIYKEIETKGFSSVIQRRAFLDDFPVNEKWLNQILYLIKDRNRFMSNQEIAESLTTYHPKYNVDKMKRKVSVVISAAYKANRIKGLIKVGTTKSAKDALWGFDNWLEDDNSIKEEHLPFGMNLEREINVG